MNELLKEYATFYGRVTQVLEFERDRKLSRDSTIQRLNEIVAEFDQTTEAGRCAKVGSGE